jgi:predicted metal-dependent phosphoesterase TrpH
VKNVQPFAQFWCCDLQTHSPLEPEFSPGVDRADTDAVAAAAEKFVEYALEAGLDALAITDHNSVAFVGPLTKAAEGKLTIFPGVEISAADGYHLLAIFEPDTSARPGRSAESACRTSRRSAIRPD